MILRSVMRHVRDQNWVAVWIDFLIVVVGVFIGIQVANWNEEQNQRQEETAILERLAVEVRALIAIQREELSENESWAQQIISANPVLFGQEGPRNLTPIECRAIVNSHVFRRPTDELPILDELQESGRFDLIRSISVKSRLRDYILLRERGRGHYREITNELFRLHSRHPDLLQIERNASDSPESDGWGNLSGAGYQWVARCDAPAMRENAQFLNEYADNAARRHSHLRLYEQRIASLLAIDEEISEFSDSDSALGGRR